MQNNQINPPWARSTPSQQLSHGAQILGQNSMGVLAQLQQTQQMFQQKLMQPQSNMSPFGVSSPMMQQSRVMQGPAFQQAGIVTYPTPRVLNPNAFQGSQNQSNSLPFNALEKRVFTGKVTKLRKDFGFVDDKVFFQVSCVSGKMPLIGEKVLVEAICNPNMPFKWNATKLQLVSDSSSRNHHDQYGSGGYSAVPIPMEEDNDFNDRNNQYRRSFLNRADERSRFRDRDELQPTNDRKRDYGNRAITPIPGVNRGRSPIPVSKRDKSPTLVAGGDRKREPDSQRDRKGDIERRSRSPLRRSPPMRRTARSLSRERRRHKRIARYAVRVPNVTFDIKETDVMVLRKRYANMYVPSDFFHAELRWVDVIPPEEPFSLDKPCSFHILPKNITSPFANDAILEPPDADYAFCAKVMLLSMPSLNEVYQKCCGFTNADMKESYFVHPTRLINFLVGIRGKNETMAIGGPWSPSLDGPNPDKDPSVLIKTAIRICKALTGIDLSKCTQWYRFVELYYRRQTVAAGTSTVAAGGKAETVVIFVPDVWSCTPTDTEWKTIQGKYAHVKVMSMESKGEQKDEPKDEPMEKEPPPDTNIQVYDLKHYSKLNPKVMTILDLRNQLQARKINMKGLKHQLIARLAKCLKQEEQIEKTGDGSLDVDDADDLSAVITIDEENDETNRKDNNADGYKDNGIFSNVALPDTPHLIVHPSRTARSGKFNCVLMTLSVLLDYRSEDSKEHSFEVSLFAELFNEMLMRDFGINIYKSLLRAQEKSQLEGDEKKPQNGDNKKDSSDKKKDEEDGNKKNKKDVKDKKDNERNKTSDKSDADRMLDEAEPMEINKCDPYLVLSYQYFDTTHCWRILENDLEKLLLSLGLRLSRAHVKKTIIKVLTGSSGNLNSAVYYRPLVSIPNEKPTDGEKVGSKVEIKLFELGNKILLPIFKTEQRSYDNSVDEHLSKHLEIQHRTEDAGCKQGGLPDVKSLMEQLKQSQQARHEINARMNELKNENKELYERNHNSASGLKNLATELDDSKKIISDLRSQLTLATEQSQLLQNAVKSIQKICSTVVTNTTNTAVNSPVKDEKSKTGAPGKSENIQNIKVVALNKK